MSTATWEPQTPLVPLVTYTPTVTGTVINTDGLVNTVDYSWSFTTRNSGETLVLDGVSDRVINSQIFGGLAGDAIQLINCTNITITNCFISDCGGYGIYIINPTCSPFTDAI